MNWDTSSYGEDTPTHSKGKHMIVRRITAGAAGLALVGTAFAAAPAIAKNKGTSNLKLDKAFVLSMESANVTIKATKGAKLDTAVVSFPVKSVKGKVINHKGAMKLTSATGYVAMQNLAINYKTGKVTATVPNSQTEDPLVIENVLVLKGGKNKIKTKGTWKNAKVTLAKDTTIGDPAGTIALVLGMQPGSIPTGATLGKITIKLKK